MQLHLIRRNRPVEPVEQAKRLPDDGFLWIDATSAEPAETWRNCAHGIAGVTIYEAHINDAAIETHPSYFDNTTDYELIIFRGWSPHMEIREETRAGRSPGNRASGPTHQHAATSDSHRADCILLATPRADCGKTRRCSGD